jgi:hypothetical protein
MTFNPHWIELDEALPHCPRARCRREGMCCNAGTETPCLRTHESRDTMYFRIAARLKAFAAGQAARPDAHLNRAKSPYEVELRLKAFKQALEERERDYERTGR